MPSMQSIKSRGLLVEMIYLAFLYKENAKSNVFFESWLIKSYMVLEMMNDPKIESIAL